MNNLRIIIAIGYCAMLAIIAGCATGESARCGDLPESPPFSDSGEAPTDLCWWTSFADAGLNQSVNQAFGGNYTLETALQRVRAARAVARREASDLFIDLDGVAGAVGNFGPGPDTFAYELGFDIAYQVDLWGAIGSRVQAQELRASSTCQDYRAVALTLSGDIAATWFSLIEATAQIELLEDQIETNEKGLEIQESRFELGLIRIADVLRQQQLLESTFEQAAIAKSRLRVLEHQLAVLLGEFPQFASYETGSVLPDLPPLPATGLPSELVCRRPDIRRDYLALCAADRDLAAAVSSQYPRLNLTASLTTNPAESGSLLQDWFVSIAGQLIAPILDGGQRRAEVDRTGAVKRQLFNIYAQTVLIAFQEVEDSLAQEKYQLERIEHLEEQVRLAGQASNQLREQYLIGDAEYLDVLSAITGQQSLQRQLLSAQLELRLVRVGLYLSLAGGFDPEVCCRRSAMQQFVTEVIEQPETDLDENDPGEQPESTENDGVEEGRGPELDETIDTTESTEVEVSPPAELLRDLETDD